MISRFVSWNQVLKLYGDIEKPSNRVLNSVDLIWHINAADAVVVICLFNTDFSKRKILFQYYRHETYYIVLFRYQNIYK